MKYPHYLMLSLLSGALVACGGGAGTGPAGTTSTGTQTSSAVGIQKTTTVAQGMVSGFGSVIVNGIHYDVKDADISVDGLAKIESDLEVGHVVHVIGTIDDDGIHGKATHLEAESQLIGAIDAIDLTAGTLSVLNQTILIDADTFFKEGLTAALLKVGDIVKVSGFNNADNQLVATHIGTVPSISNNSMQLTGVVADLDTTAKTFTINGKAVNYTDAILSDLPDATLANGQRVRLHGSIVNEIFVAAGSIRLSSLDIHHDKEVTANNVLELEGVVSEFVADTSFKLGDLTVLFSSTTTYKEGVAADLIDGVKVKVHGKLNDARQLVASDIKFRVTPQVEENGLVQAIDLTANTFTVNGIVFEFNTETKNKDEGKSKVRLFSLASLATGDLVHVRGYKVIGDSATADRFIATQVIRQDNTDTKNIQLKIEVKAKVDAVNGNVVTILNHEIELNANTKLEGFADLTTFLATAVGTRIEITAFMDGGRLLASKVSLESDEHENSSKSESKHSEVAHSTSSKIETEHSEASHSETNHSETSHSETSKTSVSSAASSKTESSKIESSTNSSSDLKSSSSVATSTASSEARSSAVASSSAAALGDAVNGKVLYDSNTMNCAGCHGADGKVININPSKTSYSGGKTLAQYISAEMPPSGATCSTQCGLDIAAYIKTWVK